MYVLLGLYLNNSEIIPFDVCFIFQSSGGELVLYDIFCSTLLGYIWRSASTAGPGSEPATLPQLVPGVNQ